MKNKESGLSFEEFCEVVNVIDATSQIYEGERPGMRDVYNDYRNKHGTVTREHAQIIGKTLSAQCAELEW